MGSSGRRWLNQSTHSLLRAELRFEGGELHRLEAAPGAPPTDRLGLEEADDRLRQRVVEGVPRPEPTEGSMPASARRPGRAGWQDAATRGPSARSARHPWRAGAGGWLAPARPRRSPPWPSGSPAWPAMRRDVAGLRPCRARHRPRTDGGRGSLIDAHARRSAGRAGEPQRHGGLRDGRARTGDPPAVHRRRPADTGLVAHSDRGSQHLATRHAERLAEAGIEPSVGSVGDSCDNALAETVIGLFKTEAIRRRGPWRSLEATEPRHARTEAPREAANGSIGSTTVARSGPSVMSRPPRPRPATTNSRRLPRWRRSLPNEITSEEPEAVHFP